MSCKTLLNQVAEHRGVGIAAGVLQINSLPYLRMVLMQGRGVRTAHVDKLCSGPVRWAAGPGEAHGTKGVLRG